MSSSKGSSGHSHGRHSHDHQHKHEHHGHHHAHHHNHDVLTGFQWAFFLNLGFAILEIVGGLYVNSVAIMSDALHDFGDSFAIGLAWVLEKFSRRGHSQTFSYGYRRWSAVSALFTSGIIVSGSVIIIVESIPRLFHPETPKLEGMFALAVIGVLVNGFAFLKIKGQSLAEKSLKWHMIEDVSGWVVVLISAVAMHFFDLPILDPILAIGLALWISYKVIQGLGTTIRVFLQAVPDHFSIQEIEKHLAELPEVQGVHHTHLWSLDGEKHIFTTHLVLKPEVSRENECQIRNQIKNDLKKTYGIIESTIEIEWPNFPCADPQHSEG